MGNTRTSFESLGPGVGDRSIQQSRGDSLKNFRQIGKADLQEEDTRSESIVFSAACFENG